jgi:hypothetical protein
MAKAAGNKVVTKVPKGHIKDLFDDTGMSKIMEVIQDSN